MKVHFFAKGDKQVGSSRYRVYQIAELLAANGHHTAVADISAYRQFSFKSAIRLVFTLLRLRQKDIVWLQRTTGPVWFLASTLVLKRILRYTLVYDFDDASYLFWPRTYRILTQQADYVVVGSEVLLQYANKYNRNVIKIPTVVSVKDYQISNKRKLGTKKRLEIVWVGTVHSHKQNLSLLIEPLRQLQRDSVKFRFTVISSTIELDQQKPAELFSFLNSKYRQIAFNNWDEPKKLAHILSTMDVGVMPLTDTEFNRGKCAFKIIEYMATGVVAVASPVGENSVVIDTNKNGMLCSSIQDWLEALQTLSANPGLRAELSQKALITVKNHYSTQAVLPKYQQILERINDEA